MLVFGGQDRVTGMRMENTFEETFSKERNLSCWKACGAVPLTRSPLSSRHVRQEVERVDNGGKGHLQLKELEQWNHFYCDYLTANGYAGYHLQTHAPMRKTTPAVTVPNTKARVQALRDAKSSRMMLYATGGQHLNSDDFFIACALAKREGEASTMLKEKEACIERMNVDQEAKSLLQVKAIDLSPDTEKKFILPECKLLCKWKGCKLTGPLTKHEYVKAYAAAARPPLPVPWTQEDESKLLTIRSEDVELKDTALGVASKQMAAAVTQNMSKLDADSRHKLLQSLAQFDRGAPDGESDVV